jgi:AcrR family transcriptional regulator
MLYFVIHIVSYRTCLYEIQIREVCLPMNYHKEEHKIVENSIIEALFILMENKPFSSITITELINKAGVARATYYRNFNSKEDILRKYIHNVLDEFKNEYSLPPFEYRFHTDHYQHVAAYINRYRFKLIILRDSGLSSLYLDELNYFLINNYQQLSIQNKLLIYSFAGAEFNLIFNYVLNQPTIDYTIFATIYSFGIIK